MMDTLLWYAAISWDYVAQMLPCMVLAAIAFSALLPWRKRRLARRGLVSGIWREGALLLFTMFCAGLAALTVFPAYFCTTYHWQEAFQGREPFFPLTPLAQSIPNIQWTPTFLRNLLDGSWGAYMVVANTMIFLPMGFFPALLWRGRHWLHGLLAGFCASFAIEFLQLFVGRATDLDDLILNTFGALIGGLLFQLLRRLAPKFTQHFQVEVRYGRETGDPKPAPGAGAGQL